jgi:hypothetical protein
VREHRFPRLILADKSTRRVPSADVNKKNKHSAAAPKQDTHPKCCRELAAA